MNEPIELLRVTRVGGEGNLRGYVDVRVGAVTICDCRIIQQPGQAAYVCGPQKYDGARWWPLVKLTPELRQRVQAVVLDVWQKENGLL